MAEPKNGENLRNAKLAKADLTGRDLRGADLTAANLKEAKLAGLDLTGAVLAKANLQDADLTGATLDNADASGAKVRGVWQSVTATGADLSHVSGQKWELRDCRLTGANLSALNVRRLSFAGCEMTDCDFTKAAAPDVIFTDCTFTNCRFEDADLSCPNITNTTFKDCVFSGSDLSGPVVDGGSFPGCDLTRADLIAGEFKKIDLADATLTKANFRYARGLNEAAVADVAARGGRVSRRVMRKALKALVSSKAGRVVAVLLVLLIAFFIHAHRRTPANWNANQLFTAAEKARDAGDFDQAMAYYKILEERSQGIDLSMFAVRAEIARTLTKQGSHEGAIEIYRELLEMPTIDDVAKIDVRGDLVRTLHLKGDMAAVMDELLVSVDSPEESINLLDMLGVIVGGAGSDPKKLDAVLAGLDKLLKKTVGGDHSDVMFQKAIVLERLERVDEAFAVVIAVEQDPNTSDRTARNALMKLAQLYQRQENTPAAREAYARLRERFPEAKQDVAFSKLNEAMLAQSQGKFDDAARIFREVIDTAEEDLPRITAQLGLARSLVQQRRFDEAEKLAADVQNKTGLWQPQHLEAVALLATIFSEQGDIDRGAAVLTKVIKNSDSVDFVNSAKRELMHVYRRGGRHQEAIALMEELLGIDADPQQAISDLVEYAEMLASVKDFGKATAALEKALKMRAPEIDIDLSQHYVGMLSRAGMLEFEVKYLNDLIAKNPTTSEISLWAKLELVSIERREGRLDGANKLMKDIIAFKFGATQIPSNFLNATHATDLEGNKLIVKFLDKVIEFETPNTFAGGHARLVLANRFLDMQDQLADDWDERAEQLATTVAEKNRDPNLIIQAYETLTRFTRTKGDLDAALKLYRAMAGNKAHERLEAMALFGQGKILLEEGEQVEGLKLLAAAKDACRDPNDCCTIAFQYGQALVNADRRKQAREVFEGIRDGLPTCWSRDEAMVMLEALD